MNTTHDRRLRREIAARLHAEKIADEKIDELLATIAGLEQTTVTVQNRENLRKIIDQCTIQPGWTLIMVAINCEGDFDIDVTQQKTIEKIVTKCLAQTSSCYSFMALRSTEYILASSGKTTTESKEILDAVRKSILSTTLKEHHKKLYFSCSVAFTAESHGKNFAHLINSLNEGIKKAQVLGGNQIIDVAKSNVHSGNNCIPFSPEVYHLVSDSKIWFHFQPIIDVARNKVFSHEALIRNDAKIEQKTLVNKFTGLLKSNEKIEIRQKAFDLMLNSFATKRIPHGSSLSINIDLFEIFDDDLYFIICRFQDDLLKRGTKVTFEILEGEKFCEGSMTVARRRLHNLREKGARIALDDFGVEQSNLSRLLELNVDYIKLDRSLIQSLRAQTKAQSIIQSTSNLCSNLGIEIIAEGVETSVQSQMLFNYGISKQQGFLFRE